MRAIRRELKLVLFYVVYILTTFLIDKALPSGPCTPGPGFLLLLLLVPISILLFLRDLYRYYIDPESSRL